GPIFSEEELVDKFVTRQRGAGDVLLQTDVSPHKAGLVPPPGKHLKTVKLPYEVVGPFIEPGSKIDMFVTVFDGKWARARQFPLLTKVNVLAVDTQYAPGGGQGGPGGQGRPTVSTLTIAVTPGESRWLDISNQQRGTMSVLVRSEESAPVKQPTDDE